MRKLANFFYVVVLMPCAQAQTDWPIYGHDPGGKQFSPLKQINTRNVTQLEIAWTYETRPAPPAVAAGETPSPARNRTSESSPLMVDGILYLGTPYNKVVALDPETGKTIWEYAADAAPSNRGLAYWPGDKQLAPQIVVGTMNGWLYTLNAKTGKLNPGFGNEGKVDLKVGVADRFPRAHYGMSSPAAIYKNLIFTGAQLQEQPADGPSGDIRAWDIHSGKLIRYGCRLVS